MLIDAGWWQAVADVMNTVGQKVTRSASRYTAGGDAWVQARRIQKRATVWRRVTQAAGLAVLLGGPVVLFAAGAGTRG